MRRILAGKSFLNRIQFSRRPKLYPTRPFCSSTHTNKPTTIDNSRSNNGPSSSASLSNYNDQYKALGNLDFMTAAKILFSDPPKKKTFGLDFHLVQLFFVCLPSLAVYLVAQYARSEMRKMDAELEKKKQAEFEAQAKEMERKAAEEKAAAASNPELLEVKERLDKLEVTVKEIVVESKKQMGDAVRTGREDTNEQKQAAKAEPDNSRNDSVGKNFKEIGSVSGGGKTSGLAHPEAKK
ncbi:hypothetical protein DH2020_038389 [Rehmannia glutinosa]|uniref:Uncharacterized protein n=1 Tax=Rehmannia glutinosa TaxID=99300 RepID=A0ABR0UZ40_REHGL